MNWFYISFAGSGGFLGATVVEGTDPTSALAEATRRGLNAGGEAAVIEILKEAETAPELLSIRNRLVGKEEMLAMGGKSRKEMTDAELERFDSAFSEAGITICSDCNETTVKR